MSAIYDCECDSFEMYEEQDSFEMAEAIPGPGVPSGGLTGQVLKKRSDEDFDTEWADESGGGGGTSDYTQLSNKPQINGITLSGNKSSSDLGLVNAETGKGLSTNDYTTADKNKLSGIEAQANKTVIDDTLTNTGEAADAKAVGNKISQLESDVQDLQGDLAGMDAGDVAYDNSLTYAAGTVGQELSSQRNTLNHKADAIYDTASGDIASFPDGADGLPVKDLTVGIEPVQDLHGYANPWPAGGGKNLVNDEGTDANNGYVYGYYLNSNGEEKISNLSTYSISEYFPLQSEQEYAVSQTVAYINNAAIVFYDSNKVVLSSVLYSNRLSFTITTPQGTAFGRTTFASNKTSTRVQVEKGNTATSWSPYSNICPISGWTECNVTRTGKNLLDSLIETANGYIDANGNVQSTGSVAIHYSYTSGYIRVKPNAAYCISGNVFGTDTDLYNAVSFYTNSKTFISRFVPSATNTGATFTTPSNCAYIRFNFARTGVVAQIQVEEGSQPTAFESYSGTTIPITFPSSAGTVYGGTLDVTSGVLTVDRAIVDLGTLSWEIVGESGSHPYYRSSVVNTLAKNSDNDAIFGLVCSAYQDGSSNDVYYHRKVCITIRTTTQRFWIWDDRGLTAEQLATGLSGVMCVYPLLNSAEYQLDPVTVTTLLGQNNIWADCGPSTVEYPCDTKLYIQKINTPTDDDMIADANIASGQYFIVNNNLYLSTTTILAGDPIKPGTNCTLTNLAAALNAINT